LKLARFTQPEINCVTTSQQQDAGAQDQEAVANELHQRLGEELVELVGIVVDTRDQVAAPVLVEERDRQVLQLGEDRIAHVEEDAPPHSTHGARLDVAGSQSDDEHAEQDAGPRQHTGKITARDVGIDGMRDDHRGDQRGTGGEQDGDERDRDIALLALDERHKSAQR
jgi:hypothetical protein